MFYFSKGTNIDCTYGSESDYAQRKILHERKFTRGMLFDLDGVLIDSEGIYTEFWDAIGKKYAVNVTDFAHVIKGNTLGRILDTYFDKSAHPQILADLQRQEQEMQYILFPGVIDTLKRLRIQGCGIAIVTSSNRRKMKNLFDSVSELRRAVDVVLTEEDVDRSKPDPQGYLRAADVLGVEPTACYVFEDSISGLKAGRASGARVIGIATTNPRRTIDPLSAVTLDSVAQFNL